MAKSSQSESLIDSEMGSCQQESFLGLAGKRSYLAVATNLMKQSLVLLVAILGKEGLHEGKATAEESRA